MGKLIVDQNHQTKLAELNSGVRLKMKMIKKSSNTNNSSGSHFLSWTICQILYIHFLTECLPSLLRSRYYYSYCTEVQMLRVTCQVTKLLSGRGKPCSPTIPPVRCCSIPRSHLRSEGSSAVQGWATLGWKSVSTLVLCDWFPFTGSLASHLLVGFRNFLLLEGGKNLASQKSY